MPQQHRNVLPLFSLLFSIGCQSAPEPAAPAVPSAQPTPAGQGWFCFEGEMRAPGGYDDHSTFCARVRESCVTARGDDPPPSVTQCTRRDKAVCGEFVIPGREGATIPPFEHCHVTAADCERRQSSLATQPATFISRSCAVVE